MLETSRLLAGTIFEQRSDVSTKRNLALLLSHMLGWERVVFLDDDIQVPDPADLSRAVGLLDAHTAVGLGHRGFPGQLDRCATPSATVAAGRTRSSAVGPLPSR